MTEPLPPTVTQLKAEIDDLRQLLKEAAAARDQGEAAELRKELAAAQEKLKELEGKAAAARPKKEEAETPPAPKKQKPFFWW